MNEELQNVIAEFVKTFLETGKEIKDFATMQIPDVIQQALLWYGVYNFILFTSAILWVYALYRFNKFQYKMYKEKGWYVDRHGNLEPYFLFNFFQTLLIIPPAHIINLEWLKIWIAPKLWLIEFASSLVTNVGGK